MAKRIANHTHLAASANAATEHSALFSITGKLDSVYVGEKYTYATIQVTQDNGYYDQYRVQCSLDFEFPDDGQQITLSGKIKRYKKNISFIDDSCSVSNT